MNEMNGLDSGVEFNKNVERESNISLDSVYQRLQIETKIKVGAENMLQVFDTFQKGDLVSKREIELQLDAANNNIAALTKEVEYYETLKQPNQDETMDNGIKSSATVKIIEPLPLTKEEILESLTSQISSIEKKDSDAQIRSVLLKKLCHWLDRYQPDVTQHEVLLFTCLRKCLSNINQDLRALSLRSIRKILILTNNLKSVYTYHLDYFIIRSLSIDSNIEAEREQAILLVRVMIDMDHSLTYVNDGILRAVLSIAEQSDQRYRTSCVQILCELMIINMETVARIGGVKIVINCLYEIPYDQASIVVKILLASIDRPSTRSFIRPGTDFELIFSVLSNSYDRSGVQKEKLKTASRLVLEFLRSWNGIMYMCIGNNRAIKSIVSALSSSSLDSQKIIMEMFYQLFDLNMPLWNANISTLDPDEFYSQKPPLCHQKNLSLIDQHYAILLHLLFESDIIERLTRIVEGNNSHMVFYATILISEILKLSNRLVSKTHKSVQALPTLFRLATKFQSENTRQVALQSLSKVDTSNLTYLRHIETSPAFNGHFLEHKQIEKIKLRIGGQVDDNHFRMMLNDTMVLADKDYHKWNWRTIIELLQGPLLNAKRMDEVIRGSKFIKRLLTFYAPGSKMFSEIKSIKNNYFYTQAGTELMNALMANQEGIKCLMEHEFLSQLKDAFDELDPILSTYQNSSFFSKDRMRGTLTPYYFTLIGTLSRFKSGINVLEKFNIFDSYYHVTELRSRDDLVRAIINHLDYRSNPIPFLKSDTIDILMQIYFQYFSREGHARLILSKVLTSAYKHIRLFATNFLRALLRKNIPGFSTWGIYLLITQLYDPSIEVCEMAVSVLDEACMAPENLATLIKLKPSMSHLEFAGDSLLLRYLSSVDGLDYLINMDYVENQMDNWYKDRNLHYVTRIELSLSRALENKNVIGRGSYWFDQNHVRSVDDPEKLEKLDGIIFPHFYGELSKTFKGCQILQDKGHLNQFTMYLKKFKQETIDPKIISDLKANLWALGHIGASEAGITLLAQADAIEEIMWIAEHSQVFSLKGTAVYVLGLLGSTRLGQEVLDEAKWCSIFINFDQPTIKGDKVIKSWAMVHEWKYHLTLPSYRPLFMDRDRIEKEILSSVGNLSNHILVKTGSVALMKIKTQNPFQFQRPDLFYQVLYLFSNYHFRLTVRQFVFNLFELQLNSETFDTFTLIRKTLQLRADTPDLNSTDMTKDIALGSDEPSFPRGLGADYSPPNNINSKELECTAYQPKKVIKGFNI